MITGTISPTIISLGRITTLADGTEQVVLQRTAGAAELIRGYVDLSAMGAGDTLIIRVYAMIATVWRLYWQESYTDAQPIPLIHILDKPKGEGLQATIQQTAGVMRSYISEFFLGVS